MIGVAAQPAHRGWRQRGAVDQLAHHPGVLGVAAEGVEVDQHRHLRHPAVHGPAAGDQSDDDVGGELGPCRRFDTGLVVVGPGGGQGGVDRLPHHPVGQRVQGDPGDAQPGHRIDRTADRTLAALPLLTGDPGVGLGGTCGMVAATGELVHPLAPGVVQQLVAVGVERRLRGGVEPGPGPTQHVDVAGGDLAVGQRVGEPGMTVTHLTAPGRRPGLATGPPTVVGQHPGRRFRAALGGQLVGPAGDAHIQRVAERAQLGHRPGQLAEPYPVTCRRVGSGQLRGQCDDPGGIHTLSLPNKCSSVNPRSRSMEPNESSCLSKSSSDTRRGCLRLRSAGSLGGRSYGGLGSRSRSIEESVFGVWWAGVQGRSCGRR